MKPFAVAAAVLLWAVTAVRVRMLAGGAAQRLLWVALLAVAIALTLDIPRVAQLTDQLPGIGTNVLASRPVRRSSPELDTAGLRTDGRARAMRSRPVAATQEPNCDLL